MRKVFNKHLRAYFKGKKDADIMWSERFNELNKNKKKIEDYYKKMVELEKKEFQEYRERKKKKYKLLDDKLLAANELLGELAGCHSILTKLIERNMLNSGAFLTTLMRTNEELKNKYEKINK